MSWRTTLGILALALIAALLVWVLAERDVGGKASERYALGRFCPYESDEVMALEIVYPEQSFSLERREEGWRLTAPVQDLADPDDLCRMLAALEAQDVTRWLPPPAPGQITEFGLDRPRPELRISTRAGQDTVRFGRLNEVEKRLWVQASWRDSLALVSTLLRTHFMKGRVELADKRPFGGVPREALEYVSIENERGSFKLAPGKQGWEIRRPESYRADDRSIIRMLERIWEDTIIEFVDLTPAKLDLLGFDRPSAVFSVKLKGENRLRRLELGRPFHRLRYARNLDRSPAFLLDSLTCAPLLESFSAFMSTVLISFRPGRVEELREEPGGRRLLRGSRENWDWRDREGRTASGRGVSILLNRLLRISTERVEALLPRQDQLREWGLAPPRLRYELRMESGRRLAVELGDEVAGRLFFRRDDFPSVYSLPVESLSLSWPVLVDSAPTGSGTTDPR